MRVLADLHHKDLFESLRLLFEVRLGADLYRPFGMDWWHQGFWKYFPAIETAQQYLNPPHNSIVKDGICYIPPRDHFGAYKGIELELFKSFQFDIIISSYPANFYVFEQLRKQYHPKAKHIFQMGNTWPVPVGCLNLLNSTAVEPSAHINHVRYHQEFSTKIFKPVALVNPKSVVNLQHYMNDFATFSSLEQQLPDWNFKAYGAGNRDGLLNESLLPDTFANTGFIFHVKKQDEGYGYNLHRAMACGRPLITDMSYFATKISRPLLTDGVTCLDIRNKSFAQIISELTNMADNYQTYSDNAYQRFCSVVDFDAEFVQIQNFLANLR
jgi:glycosyltransferase involved in cell wall biosynthesis